jgi:hypothetical protein
MNLFKLTAPASDPPSYKYLRLYLDTCYDRAVFILIEYAVTTSELCIPFHADLHRDQAWTGPVCSPFGG